MKRLIVLCIAVIAFQASADDDRRAEYAKVISATPIYRTIETSEPFTRCEPVQVEVHRERRNPGAKLVGAIIGGVIGHHVGRHHNHRGVGTAVGAITGAHIGGQIAPGRKSACNTGVGRLSRVMIISTTVAAKVT